MTKKSSRAMKIIVSCYAVIATLILTPYRFYALFLDHKILASVLLLLVLFLLVSSIKSKLFWPVIIYSIIVTLLIALAMSGLVFLPYTF
jgi:hypothetical protein